MHETPLPVHAAPGWLDGWVERAVRSFLCPVALCAGLLACGGGTSMELTSDRAAATDAAPLAAQSSTSDSGTTAGGSNEVDRAASRKALAVRIPVYRFFNASTGAHFFTTSTAERDNIIATLSPPFGLEGVAFSVASAFAPGLSPVHRFYNTQTGVHFYTISEAERAHVVATLPHFRYEGVAYHASQVAGAGLIPFYRFYVASKGFHF